MVNDKLWATSQILDFIQFAFSGGIPVQELDLLGPFGFFNFHFSSQF